jgi:hypothetical protein
MALIRAGVVAATAIGFASTGAQARDSEVAAGPLQRAASLALHLIASGYRAAPALMVCLALIIGTVLASTLARGLLRLRRDPQTTRRYRGRPLAQGNGKLEDVAAPETALPGHAYVEIVGAPGSNFEILRDMLRIGREDDNDIRFESKAVHRYHAAIHREDRGDYWITDLSGIEGNGLLVNGRRCGDARLADGDLIECGPGRLRFHAGLV